MEKRRQFMTTCAALSTTVLLPDWGFAEELTKTPKQGEGPFYPDRLPLDTDNDLLIVNDSISSAVGDVTHLTGRILDPTGNPVRNAQVEIWQVDANGRYLHTEDAKRGGSDKNFQGFGRFTTATKGEYYFRTIKPVPYPGRTPHIHFAVKINGKKRFSTQCYIKGDSRNAKDGVLKSVKDKKAANSLMVDFKKMENSKIGELKANFDIVLGFTPENV
ncbi:MAG: protocatechuate 3,4-dioxygenase [Pirellulaceae bacterium]|nr:protocatechuate 3,4-dioxygenase [Pirellulaceae bacterium]